MTEQQMAIIAVATALGIYLWRVWCTGRKDLGFRSTNVLSCAWCGVRITAQNDSGWEVFVTGNMTQRCCKTCFESKQPKKGDPAPRSAHE